MTLSAIRIAANLTDYTTRDPADSAIGHATACARGLAALFELPLLGLPDYNQRPEALISAWTVSYGETRDELGEDSQVTTCSMPARVTATLAVPDGWSFEQLEQALRTLGERIRGAAQRENDPTWDGVWRARPGN